MSMKTKIYVICEIDGEIRYIGKTIRALAKRFWAHLYNARRGENTYLYNWMRSVLSTGHLPLIQLIGEVAGDGCKEERAWIAYGRAEGWRLVNQTDGGDGVLGHRHSQETRNKLSIARKRRVTSIETRRKMSEAFRGVNHPLYGTHHSIETRKKMSEAKRGKNHWIYGTHRSKEVCQKLSIAKMGSKNPMSGKHPSKETLKKLSESRKGKIRSRETRSRMSEAAKGKIKTPEHRRKIGEASKRYWKLRKNNEVKSQ